jgi:ATPase subunit of ABC transporter with duplicated ATPase domains
MMITHDRYFLDNVTGWILELDRGRGIPYEGNYTAYLAAKAKRMQQEGREEAARQRALSSEQAWIASSPRRARPSRKPVFAPMTNWSRVLPIAAPATRRSSSRPASASAMW